VSREISATTVSLPDGPVTYGIFRDVSEQVEREQELEETTQRLQLARICDGTDTGVWDWTIGTGEVRWSESLERLVGIDPGTFEGTVDAFAEYIHPDDRQRALDAVERAAETESEFETEYRFQREDRHTSGLNHGVKSSTMATIQSGWLASLLTSPSARNVKRS